MIREIKTPAALRVQQLRHAIRRAVEQGGSYVQLGPGSTVSLEYARHVLACLLEAQPDHADPADPLNTP